MTRRFDDLSDAELLSLARDGDSHAYGALFKRHWHAGKAMAVSITNRFDADDLASEAFARILRAVEKGKGPKSGFRSYLATTIRNVAIDWSRRKTTPTIEDADVIEDWTYSELTALDRIERETMAKAFYALPDSWQEVLWYTEVEDMAPREVAPLLGLTPNAVSALAVRAREGLRQSWINAHLANAADPDPEHAWVLSRLGSHVRGKISRTDRAKVAAHLRSCDTCADAAEEADRVGSRLALGILPLFLGLAGAGAYLAWTGERSGAAVAATLPAAHPLQPEAASSVGTAASATPRGGVFGRVLASGGSASSAGMASVAAVVAAAVVTTGAILGVSLSADAQAQSIDAATSATGARATGSGSAPTRPVATETTPAPSSQRDVPAPAPTDAPVSAGPETTEPAAEAPQLSTPIEPSGPAPEPTPPGEPAPPTGPTPEPTPPAEPPVDPAPAVDGCEAAVRSVPVDDILLAYRLDDPAGSSTASDFVTGSTGRYAGSTDQPGWSLADTTERAPTDTFTIQIRFLTDAGGGRLIGFSSAQDGDSVNFDRHLFLADDGRVVFGVYPDPAYTIASPDSYADSRWHQATATLSTEGMKLYVDGELVAQNASITHAQGFSGYWRIGYDNLNRWGPDTPTNRFFPGRLAYAAVYTSALTPEQIRAQWNLCGAG